MRNSFEYYVEQFRQMQKLVQNLDEDGSEYKPSLFDLKLVEEFFELPTYSLVTDRREQIYEIANEGIKFYLERHCDPGSLVLILTPSDQSVLPPDITEIRVLYGTISIYRLSGHNNGLPTSVRSKADLERFGYKFD